jgi:malonyl CoA-acyl carrier protein transacylase
MHALPQSGEMVCVFASEARVRNAVEPYRTRASIAAVNGPESITVSGERAAVREIVAALQREGVKVRVVSASYGFHSPLMDPMLDEYERVAATVAYRRPMLPLVSSVTGTMATDHELSDPKYWRRHVREAVQFGSAMQTIWDRGCRVFVEIGPNQVLLGMAQRALPEGGSTWLPSVSQTRSDQHEMLSSLAALYVAGLDVRWDGLHHGVTRRRLSIPTYPFQRERYWALDAPGPALPTTKSRWEPAIAAAAQQATVGPFDLWLPSYPAKWARLEDLSVSYVVQAFRDFGVFATAGERRDARGLRTALGIREMYETLIQRWLEKLAERGHLRRDGDQFVADAPLPGQDTDAMVKASADLFVDFPAPLQYLSRSGAKLVDLLLGRESALEMLFPGGSNEIADNLYSTSPLSRYSNAIARAAVTAAAATATPTRPLRILEIGAGTGGTTAGLLPALPPESTEYCFTDVGALFLGKAQDRFSEYPFISYRMMDIEKHPQEQGFAPHSFDVIIAANVLHATKNLHETLDHVAWLLAPGGLLALCEATRHPFWFDVTTGLIGGWQRFADDLRHDVPLITPATWERGLLQHGFDAVKAFPEAGSPAEVLGQHVIVARGGAQVGDHAFTAQRVTAAHGQRPATSTAAPKAPVTEAAPLHDQLAALSESERLDQLTTIVCDAVVQVLRLDASRPPQRDQRLMDFGVDSLMAVELRNVLTRRLALTKKLPATLIFDYPTVGAIAQFLSTNAFGARRSDAPSSPAPAADAAAPISAEQLEQMSDEAVEALLNQRLGTL